SANERARFDRTTQGHDTNKIAVLDLQLRGQLRRNFREHFRLQFRQVWQEARHTAGGMMLGQPIRRENIRKPRIPWRSKTVLRASKPIDHWVRVARIKEIVHRRFQWL